MNWSLFWSTFGLVFVAELGDKTQLAVMAQSAATKAPVVIFLAGAAALVAASAVGALAGSVLSRFLSPRILNILGALLFFAFGGFMLWKALHGDPAPAPQP